MTPGRRSLSVGPIEAIFDLQTPTTHKQLQALLGLCGTVGFRQPTTVLLSSPYMKP